MTNHVRYARFGLGLAFLLTTAGEVARAEDPPVTREAECRWAVQPPKIDGKLDDPAWKAAAVIDRFPSFWKKTEPGPDHATKARLVWDHDALYFSSVMTDADLRAFGTRQNDHLWNGDVFELFFKPSKDRPEYFEFQVNPNSVRFEAAFVGRLNAVTPFDARKPLGMTAVALATGPEDETKGWIVEGKIPWTAFGPTVERPEPGSSWTFALCRYDYYGPENTDPILMSSAPLTQPNFHRFEDYGKLLFQAPASN
ncbi:carbohydrate-binding family 9-like protein [Tundrisphaera lichenicola]|uniref:carbohydrate-binding family 9-like protein n=1 Tax=Tundrisphaera lichenicola TaxID=2029860 RepID=UPI003EB9065B